MSEAERGSTGEDSGRITPTPYNRRSSIERSSSTSGDWTSPIHGRRLPFTGGAEGRRPWWFWPALLATFVLSAIAWRPVLRPLVYGRRPHGGLEHAERVERDGASPHVHVFHEPRCAGESVTLKGAADLCGRHYPSGEPLKDNVASVLLSGAAVMLVNPAACLPLGEPIAFDAAAACVSASFDGDVSRQTSKRFLPGCVCLGFVNPGGELTVVPPPHSTHKYEQGDRLVVIAREAT